MSNLMSSLPSSTIRGITLNNQHFDLFEIIDDKTKTDEEKMSEVVKYLESCREIKKTEFTVGKLIVTYADYTAQKLSMPLEEKIKLLQTIRDNIEDVFDREKMVRVLNQAGFSNSEQINDTLMEATDNQLTRIKEGITDFIVLDGNGNIDKNRTYVKVNAFYEHVISEENGRKLYNRIDLDDIASPTCYMTIQKNSTRPRKLYKAIRFCEEHGMSAKINSAFFYLHSHYPSNPSLKKESDLISYYEKYFDDISKRISDTSIEEIDIFNEFVYRDQPQIVGENDIQYAERHNGMHAILPLETICDLVKTAREKMPNISFLYNDDGWEKPEKREGIFREIERIRHNEEYPHQLINSIGMQFHTSINIDIEEIRRAVEECKQRFPDLNVNITELDIGEQISGFDYKNATPEELEAAKMVSSVRKKQIMSEILKLAEEGKISEVTLWSQSDEMCFKGKESGASLNRYDASTNTYSGQEIELTLEEKEEYNSSMQVVLKNIVFKLAKEFKTDNIKAFEKLLLEYMPEAQKYYLDHKQEITDMLKMQTGKPVQDFNLHTHTQRCGHAAEFTEDFEYVNQAIKAGMKTLAFTDHMPFPETENVEPNVRMLYQELPDYLASIEYLKREYEGLIDVKSGFEFEYLPEFEEHLNMLKSKSDLMVLGQHFVKGKNGERVYIDHGKISNENLKQYSDLVLNAIRSGYPNIIAHPDIFMRGRTSWGPEEEAVAIQICETAARANIPLEINMGEIGKNRRRVDKNLPESEQIKQITSMIKAPCRDFWKVAMEKGCMVLYGKDAHSPTQLSEDMDYEIVKEVLGEDLLEKLNFVTLDENGRFKPIQKLTETPVVPIEKTDIQQLASSPEIDVPNQTLDSLIVKMNEKDGEKVNDNH